MTLDNDVLKAIQNRHSKRAFLPKPVPKEWIEKVLTTAAQAPSSKNTQPWQVAIVQGGKQADLSRLMCAKFDQGEAEDPDYTDTPEPWPEGFKDRARACGYGLFELKGIERRDFEARKAHNRENLTFFEAPLSLIFHLPAGSERGQFLDMGFYMQNVMLGFLSLGIGSCPQYSLTSYSKTIREFLNLEGRWIVSGLALGFPDPDAPVNTYIPERLTLDKYTQWFE